MVAGDQREWVAFREETGSSEAVETTLVRKPRKPSTSRKPSISTTWMSQPILADSAWTPLAPPAAAQSQSRLPSKKNPTSPQAKLQPVNPPRGKSARISKKDGSTRVKSTAASASSRTEATSAHTEWVDFKGTQKPERALSSRTQTTESTSNSSKSGERARQETTGICSSESGKPAGEGEKDRSTIARSSHSVPVRSHAAGERGRSGTVTGPPSRGRSESRTVIRPPTRGRSESRSGVPTSSTSTRGRSTSRSRAVASSKRPRSLSRSSNSTRSRGRSRPPATRNNNVRRNRSRSRSASLTRVTGPHSSSIHDRANRPPHPPSTARTLQEMKMKASSRSIGPGVNPDGSFRMNSDDNIGRNISFDRQISNGSATSKGDGKNKKSSLMEKLFGDQINRPAAMALPGSFKYEIRPRTLLAATVYHNTATNLWITTINTNQRGVAKDPTMANRYLKAFSFSTEREARESAIANAPPKMVPFNESPGCFICKGLFAVFRRACHCRNCGVCVCNNCSTSWPAKMIPDTYNLKKESHVKICLSCNSLSSSFKKALMQGDYEEAVALYGTGNVNLRTPFPVSNKKDEIMHPIHCAVEGGNLDIIRWLVDDHFCPIKLVRTGTSKKKGVTAPILTSKGRSILSIAIDRVKVDIMRYLVIECGVSIYESTDLKSTLRALEAALIALPVTVVDRRNSKYEELPVSTRWDKATFDDISEPSSLGVDEPLLDDGVSKKSNQTKNSRNGDACIICCDKKIDCCATPCGHQICCLECSSNLTACPVCNTRGEFIKIFRP